MYYLLTWNTDLSISGVHAPFVHCVRPYILHQWVWIDARSVFIYINICEWEYLCVWGKICCWVFIPGTRALQLHPVTHTCTHNHTHVCTRKHILPLLRTFARINRSFLMPLAVVRLWNWSTGSQIWQPGPDVWDAPHFRPASRHFLLKTPLHLSAQ